MTDVVTNSAQTTPTRYALNLAWGEPWICEKYCLSKLVQKHTVAMCVIWNNNYGLAIHYYYQQNVRDSHIAKLYTRN